VNAQVNAQNPSTLEYLWTISTNQMPAYVQDDVPVNTYAQSVFKKLGRLIDDYPTVCGGGTYSYLGREFAAGPVNGFVGAISESDSKSGNTKGALFEGGGGEGVVGGLGYVASTTGGQASGTGLAYVGVGGSIGAVSGSVGIVGFGSSKGIGGVGVYGEGFLNGRGGGIGAYANITKVGGCHN
jgi:hypothetical protein